MRVETRKERFWSRLVTPILWPVLLAQLLLVALGLAAGLIYWWLMPAEASWSITFWLLLALLLGGGLNVAVFLTLLKQRLRRCEHDTETRLAHLADCLTRHADATVVPRDMSRSPMARFDDMVAAVETLIEQWQGEMTRTRQSERHLAEELQAQRGRVERLEAERERAREASRLKSDYLAHLQQTLMPSLTALEESLADARQRPEAVDALREQLVDALALLETLDESPSLEEGPSARVLIVDDGPVNLMLAQQVLERQGLQVVTAASGSEALQRLGEMPVDLIFMDIFMADMDGVETCRLWREREASMPERTRSVVVALTANVSEADRQRFAQVGMDDYLAKPYRPQDLLETVRHWLPGALKEGGERS
ncbi:response regulator [Halomonas caseinilytica]|uniref:Response regulator receiver domain-containing protein n=1 Tax=Halomonas caseinilytica TaxID=438744 RepID=A0A1M6RT88_9GAMM|nr:response regulator [Halomonas caseinilytica]SHK35634.1 Response regulator receiver domain-containing protein [Halomonas caseinilytica]